MPLRPPERAGADVGEAARPAAERAVFENDATRNNARYVAAHHAHDWDAILALFADDFTTDDRRSVVAGPLDHEQSMESVRIIFDGRGTFEQETLATRGRSARGHPCALARAGVGRRR